MKSTYLMSALFVCSLAFNFYQASTCEKTVAPCLEAPTYADALPISNIVARTKYQEFIQSTVRPDTISGGIIAKDAFDKMFCLPNCNAVAYSFARDASGTVGPLNKGIFLIVEGVNITFDASSRIVVNSITGSQKYRSGSWCPPSCMKW